ncbi:MAG: glycosyltransferase family 2 protein [Sphaerochaetaceae bacterium]|nr:glycosyltransferase family 2 protein [Sphaerochaetaceae bacterium]
MKQPLVSIFTCVYNRKDKIHRVFESVAALSYKNIEHVIVDDGSTDGVMPLLMEYKEKASYPVLIFQKENGGKHTATNLAWDNCHGEYIIQLDSDDMLLPQSIEHLVELWNQIPEDKKNEYWCVQGRCCTQFSDEIIGPPNPENINEMDSTEASRITEGERVGLMKASILKNYRYPEPKGVKFVKEAVLWNPLNREYKTWYTDEVMRRYFVDEGENLSRQKLSRQTITNKAWSCAYQISVMKEYKTKGFKVLVAYCFLYFHTKSLFRKNTPYLIESDSKTELLQILLLIPALLAYFPIEILLISTL